MDGASCRNRAGCESGALLLGLASLALLGGCFSIPADEQPTHSQHHIELLIDAGRWDVNAGPRDAGHSDAGSADTGQPDAGPSPGVACGDQTCDQGVSCLIVFENQNWELHCLSRLPDKPADAELTSRLARRCIEFEAPQEGHCDPGDCGQRQFRGCMEHPDINNEVVCFREHGSCANTGECAGRDGRNNLQCESVDEEEGKYESALRGRCRAAEMELHQLMGGAIGFWARKDDRDVCGLAHCDESDVSGSCTDYLQVDSDHGGALLPQLFADVLAPGATCGAIPDHAGAPQMCDWQECGQDRDCRRQYLIREARCVTGWCKIDGTEIYLNEYAHGPGTEDSHRGIDRCNNHCDQGRVCAVNSQTEEISCVECNSDADCPDDAKCWQGENGGPGSCRYPCGSQQDCIHGELCNEGAGHCERDHGGPRPNANPCEGFNCGDPNLQCQNVEIRPTIGPQVWQPVCQEISCQTDQGCEQAPGSVCHPVNEGQSECTIHGLCQGDGECGGGGCRMFTNDESVQQRLCLDLRHDENQCDNDDDCIGRKCLLGRICGFYQDSSIETCPDNFSSFAGFCPQPPACANHHCQPNEDCRAAVMDLNGHAQVRAWCTPRACSQGGDQNCPVPFFCKPGENGGPDSCEYAGFCGGEVRCPDGMECQSYQGSHCVDLSSDCNVQSCGFDYACLGGFCATSAESPEACTNMADHQQFAGYCKPQSNP